VDGLGDEFTPVSVGLQQERHAPVDDVVVHGQAPGGERTLRIACRHKPKIRKSDESTVKLFADFVQMVLENASELDAGTLRLGLAVEGPYGPAAEVGTLAEVARWQDDRTAFQAAVAAPGAYSADVRKRLTLVDELVVATLAYLDSEKSRAADPTDVSWRLLRSLFVLQVQFEGTAAPGRTQVVTRLQAITGDAARAEALRLRLIEIAAEAAIRAGALTRAMLRRELRPFGALGASADFVLARSQVELLEAELRQRTRHALQRPGQEEAFVLDRSEKEEELARVIAGAEPGQVVVVHGEPDVGKSALALAAVERVRRSGGTALMMSLRDLPPAVVQIRTTIGLAPTELLSGAPSAPVSILLLDGTEVVQEGSSDALGTMLAAAAEAGVTPVLVVRDDARGAVGETIAARGKTRVVEFAVEPLTTDEIEKVVAAIPDLMRLARDTRAAWLLRRLGLMELLLRAAENGNVLPDTLSSEAEVFATVWAALVRRRERIIGNVSPDDREAALTATARRLVAGSSAVVPGAALATLRSDGILLSRGRAAAWQTTDSFASDVLRDFATARLFLGEGLDLLVRSSGSRWPIRAARLYAQARMSEAVASGVEAVQKRWREVRSEFASLAEAHGPRWAELPWEALLGAGWAYDALTALSPDLQAEPALRDELVRCVSQRFSSAGAADPVVAAPVVRWFSDAGQLSDGLQAYRDDPVGDLVLFWLRGVAHEELSGRDVTGHAPLRERVREEILVEASSEYPGRRCLEGLALLGSDSSAATDDALRAVAKEAPHRLLDVVESVEAAALLVNRDPGLLAELAEAYYIEPEKEPSPWGNTLMDEGIRDHGPSGWFDPQAAWYRGPFRLLLGKASRQGLVVIELMLERAARDRSRILEDLDSRLGRPAEALGMQMSLLGTESRRYVGDPHVWYWYRGSSVGPYPCMSALLALEKVMDEYVQAGLTLRKVADWLLRHAQTLATPGLLYGFLVRHLEKVTDELDDFLAVPEVWDVESRRLVNEGMLHIQGPDPKDLVGRERRKWQPATVAGYLVVKAAQNGDDAALERLRGVGRRLLDASGGAEAPAHVKQWAAVLDWDTYVLHPHEEGYVIEAKPPDEVEQALAPARKQSDLTMRMYGLMNRYRQRAITPYRQSPADLPDDAQLALDIETVEEIVDHLPESPRDEARLSVAGLAASLVHGAANGRPVEAELLQSAVDLLIDCAVHPYLGDFPNNRSVFPDGADRKAALVLPSALLLMGRSGDDGTPRPGDDPKEEVFEEALRASTTSLFLEVRWNAAEGLRPLLEHPCSPLPDGRCCHALAWLTIEAAARSSVLGPFQNGQRPMESLEGDLAEALTNRPDNDLMVTHIAPAAASALDAAATPSCIQAGAARLVPVLLDAYGRAAHVSARGNYRWPREQQAAFASAVLRSAAAGNREMVVEMAARLRGSPDALANFLDALTVVATYEPEHAGLLGKHWPALMRLGLETIQRADKRRRWDTEELIRKLIPSPATLVADVDLEVTLERARALWPSLDAVAENIDEWINLARKGRNNVDALIGLLQAQPLAGQVEPGLDWVRRLVVAEDRTARLSGFLLIGWLGALRESKVLDATTLPKYRTIVDALALGNFAEARELQRRDE
jgi:hypothetical protein